MTYGMTLWLRQIFVDARFKQVPRSRRSKIRIHQHLWHETSEPWRQIRPWPFTS